MVVIFDYVLDKELSAERLFDLLNMKEMMCKLFVMRYQIFNVSFAYKGLLFLRYGAICEIKMSGLVKAESLKGYIKVAIFNGSHEEVFL